MNLEVARHFLVALFIGALVGVEREQRRSSEPERVLGGVRTHILLALVGATSAWLARELASAWVFAIALAAVSAVVVAGYVRRGRDPADQAPGLTSEIAAMAVVLLGAMVVVGDAALGVALAVAVSAVLAFKQPLHVLVAKIGTEDLLAAIKLMCMSFIVLPLLPRTPVDPWNAVNLYQLWLLVILTSALSLVGYLAMRWLGSSRGTAITGLAGGLVSSTATTLSFARASRSAEASPAGNREATGILLSWLVMFLRVLVLVAVVNPSLLQAVWIPLTAMGAATGAFALAHYLLCTRTAAADAGSLAVRNPFQLGEALRFGLLFAVILLLIRLAQIHLPQSGFYVVSALAGSADVDAITLSLAHDGHTQVQTAQAATALCVALLSNTVVKTATVLLYGRGRVRHHTLVAAGTVMLVGVATLLMLA
ncbi:MgtC/SapB family protein [Piscinibacter terrae]|uniref:MgtC/SapB family protein n=1 Tax=Piscinibacter terrae TaxID=2496871 RepID=A0A3N7HJN5_9BURK|nr:MgtC/SapB family protein [Albitalea terrae]RQP21733.1 MgtC/SapB family protein [Albitalea terrae]